MLPLKVTKLLLQPWRLSQRMTPIYYEKAAVEFEIMGSDLHLAIDNLFHAYKKCNNTCYFLNTAIHFRSMMIGILLADPDFTAAVSALVGPVVADVSEEHNTAAPEMTVKHNTAAPQETVEHRAAAQRRQFRKKSGKKKA